MGTYATYCRITGHQLPPDGTKVYDKQMLRNALKVRVLWTPESRRKEISG
jgi:hypothetical protein